MEDIIQTIRNNLASILTEENVTGLKQSIQLHINQLQNFQFFFNNPIFVIIVLLALLMLSGIWGFKKAFSYCLIVSVTLYLASRLVANTNIQVTEGATITYADVWKGLAIFIIILVTIYYGIIRND